MKSTNSIDNEDISNCFFRILAMAKMVEQDAGYFLPYVGHSGIKNALHILKNSIANNSKVILHAHSADMQQVIKAGLSDEKIASLHNIVSRLILMDEQSIAQLEDDIIQATKVINTSKTT